MQKTVMDWDKEQSSPGLTPLTRGWATVIRTVGFTPGHPLSGQSLVMWCKAFITVWCEKRNTEHVTW